MTVAAVTTAAAALNANVADTKEKKEAAAKGGPARPYTGRPNPINVAYEQKVSQLEVKINTAKARLDDLYAGGKTGGNAADREARNALFEQLKKVREEMRPHSEEKRRLFDQMTKIREDIKRKTGETKEAKEKLPFRSIPEMEQRVAEMEAQIESGQLKLTEEKQMLAEISKLKRARRQMENLDGAGSDVTSLKLRVEKLRSDIATKETVIAELRTKADGISKQIEELGGGISKEDAAVARQERQEAIDKLKKDLNGFYEERRKAYDDFKAEKKAQAEARVKREARRAEYEKRRVLEEQLEDLEEKLLAFNPETATDKKMSECNNLKVYFQDFLPASKEQDDAGNKKSEAGTRKITLSAEYADAVPIKKDDADLCFFGGNSKKHNKSSKGIQHENAHGGHQAAPSFPAKLPFHILSALADLHLSIPTKASDIPDIFVALDKKKEALASKQDDSVAEKEQQRQAIQAQVDELKKQLAQPVKVNAEQQASA